MSKKICCVIFIFIIVMACGWIIQNKKNKNDEVNNSVSVKEKNVILVEDNNQGHKDEDKASISVEDLNLQDVDGNGTKYVFVYKDTVYEATYTKDNWHIANSYNIKNDKDIAVICQALTIVHPIHGKDMISYRAVDDLVYEWVQHNLAYDLLPEGNEWKNRARDVDLNPADQGRSIKEMYEARLEKNTNNTEESQ